MQTLGGRLESSWPLDKDDALLEQTFGSCPGLGKTLLRVRLGSIRDRRGGIPGSSCWCLLFCLGQTLSRVEVSSFIQAHAST